MFDAKDHYQVRSAHVQVDGRNMAIASHGPLDVTSLDPDDLPPVKAR